MSRSVLTILSAHVAALLLFTGGARAAEYPDDDIALFVNEGKWTHGPNAVERTPDKQAQKAKRLEGIGDSRQAAEQFRRLGEAYSESDLAEEGLVLSARNYLKIGDFTKARAQIEELRRRYVNPTYLDAMGEVEIALARGFLDGKGEGGTYMLASRIRKAKAIFKKQFDGDPQGRWADDALYGLGNCAEVLHDYDGAIKKYKELLDKYPRSELRAEVESHIVYCINKRHPSPDYSEAETAEANQRLKLAKDEANNENGDLDKIALDENEKLLIERMAQKRFDQAMFYKVNSKYRAAEVYFELIKEKYPKTKYAPKAQAELDDMRKKMGAGKTIYDRVFK